MLQLNTRDIVSLSPHLFDMIEKEDNYILLISKFTFHKWKLGVSEHFIEIYHSHSLKEELHYQTSCLDIYNAMLYILDHEDYQLNNRKKVRVLNSQYQQFSKSLIKIYGLQ